MAPSTLQEGLGRYNVARERRKPRIVAFWKLLGYSLVVAGFFYATAAMSGALIGRWWAFPALGMLWFGKKAFDQYALVWGTRTPVATQVYGSAENATLADVKRAGMTGTYPPERRLYLGLQVLVEEENGEKTFKKTGRIVRTGPPKSDSYQTSIFVLGTTGAGKTLGLVAQTTLIDGSLLIVDTGEVAAMTAKMREKRGFGETILLDPFGHLVELTGDTELKSWGFNPMFSIEAPRPGRNEDEIDTRFVKRCTNIGKGLILRSNADRASESHWLDTAEQVAAGLVMWECLDKAPGERSFGNIRDVITGGPEAIQIVAAKAKRNYPELKEIHRKLGRFASGADLSADGKSLTVEEATGELKSVVSALDTQTAFLDDDEYVRDLCPRGGNRFTWADLKARKCTIMLVLPPREMADDRGGKWWLRLLINEAVSEMLATRRNKQHAPVRFVLDEFAHLGRLPVITSAMNLGRKHGVTFMLLGQNRPQFERVYGETALKDMESACGTKICYRTRDQQTAAHFSALAGQTTVITKSESVHRTVPQDTYQYRPEGIPLWRHIDIAKLPDRTAIVISSDLPGKVITVETPGIYEPAAAPWRKYMEANPYAP